MHGQEEGDRLAEVRPQYRNGSRGLVIKKHNFRAARSASISKRRTQEREAMSMFGMPETVSRIFVKLLLEVVKY
jgi:hypothetical protein